ncbi:spore protease YyaC [Cerasibacillus terrae]|uniref:Spore protease YyaC n=1 Tax=Cerasibacillus terrae TaxID=2498845 RepID=A0A5C8NQH1_9BACI|nr:spore protease YyaC [Cerasibacillus terrae]TXL63386.1 spore protease YyaC [Cerasibacillus terrae]
MNPKYLFQRKSESTRAHFENINDCYLLFQKIISWFPKTPREYIVACIGTDRSTGDALGPLVGTYLSEKKPKHLTIYGTLQEPVHATNLTEYIDHIQNNHQNPFIIAIDACLGKPNSIGNLIASKEALKPGAALNKSLPLIGDIHIAGVVNVSGFMEYAVLQNTRLSFVNEMAKELSNLLMIIDAQLVSTQHIQATIHPSIDKTKFSS